MVADLPALLIVVVITYLVYIGIKESKRTANLLVLLKVLVILLVILVGIFYVNPPTGALLPRTAYSGVLKGVSAVFFAYIGFDAISTTAEECREPAARLAQSHDLYAGYLYTLLYVVITLVLTGWCLTKNWPLAIRWLMFLSALDLNFMAGVVSVSAVIAMASVLLVFQLGQPRIWMTMSRDGLLPKVLPEFTRSYKTPSFSTIVTGFVVAVPALFMNLTEVTDLTSIGTLFAFVLVCGGILVLERSGAPETGWL